jgi:hypothetical protein
MASHGDSRFTTSDDASRARDWLIKVRQLAQDCTQELTCVLRFSLKVVGQA